MKKRSSLLSLASLALMLVMYNCQRVTDPLPTGPNAELLKGFSDIKMKTAPATQPEAVVSTPSALIPSTKLLDVQAGLKSGNHSTVQRAADDVSAALSAQDIAQLAEMTPADLKALETGGTLSAGLQAALDRAIANPVLSTYLPKMVLPTVKEIAFPVVVPERDVNTGSTDKKADNTCKKQAQEAYKATLDQLKDQRKNQLSAAAATNKSNIASIKAGTATCKSGVTASYSAQRVAAQQQAAANIAAINSNPSNSAVVKRLLIALVNASLSKQLADFTQMEAADKRACDQAERAALAANEAAYEANKAQIEANYDAAVAQAEIARQQYIANCEYQQGIGS
ncbi:hypothetical protein [Salmonirosea aquatica]|uniref:Uncharacterized protein n=1 Tax=Salmonirosea aquatica TaxID=2654236 RepID=A0A7C9BDA0_9BACT|nr:hypothetical protein [Cytophagaceae bacterium SJW1-29]